MKIVLIGNYVLDKQESMERFAIMLSEGFRSEGISAEIWRPCVLFGKKFLNPYKGIGKYLGYFDKYIIFPFVLKARLLKKSNSGDYIRFHVCDHSNAPYLKYLPKNKSGITCHDVLAIRGSMGFTDAFAPASKMGVILQKWILKNLSKASVLAAVSNFTLDQLNEISEDSPKNKKWKVIYNAFNAPFSPMEISESKWFLRKMKMNTNTPFILHVGSGDIRKNRKLLLQMVTHLDNKWNGTICYAGKPLETNLIKLVHELNLSNRVISIVEPSHEELVSLYSTCEAFVFPSFSEGFGWPLIEAQACGAPVIASHIEPMPEISGNKAIHVNPHKPEEFANALLSLKNKTLRENIIKAGYSNTERFLLKKIIKDYIKLYEVGGDNIETL